MTRITKSLKETGHRDHRSKKNRRSIPDYKGVLAFKRKKKELQDNESL